MSQLQQRVAGRGWEPVVPGPLPRPAPAERVRAHPGLDYAHHHWALPNQPPPSGADVKGRVRTMAGRAVFSLFSEYLGQERELVSSLVRLGDTLAIRCDELTEQLEVLRHELDQRAVARAASDAELAGVVDGLRRRVATLEERLQTLPDTAEPAAGAAAAGDGAGDGDGDGGPAGDDGTPRSLRSNGAGG